MLIQHGANAMSNLKQNDKTMQAIIQARIIQEILRKCLNSLAVSGFSGVSRGQNINITTAQAKDIQSSAIFISYILESLIRVIEPIMAREDNISHLVSLFA